MTLFRLITNSLKHYWRTNSAVLLGIIAATAVIAGALIVGDSVRNSLQQMTLDRLGDIDYVVNSHRFVREELVDDLHSNFDESIVDSISPALLMTGSLERMAGDERLFAAKLNVFGIDERTWELTQHGDAAVPTERSVVLNHRTAEELQTSVGDEVTMWVELPTTIPRDALLGEREEVSKELVLTVADILPEESGAGRLDLNPNQQLPRNAFVSLDTLQGLLELDAGGRRNPRVARINTLFLSSKADVAAASPDEVKKTVAALNKTMATQLNLKDLHLRIDVNEKPQYLSLESSQLFLEDEFAWSAEASADGQDVDVSPLLVYLANQISNPTKKDEKAKTGYSMYSVIAGVDFKNAAPFGPFEVIDGPSDNPGKGQIVLNEWLAADLEAKVGDTIQVDYMTVGSTGETTETITFKVHSIIKLDDTAAADPGFTPEVPGFTNVKTLQDLDLPFVVSKELLTDRDEEYWEAYKATPKAFVSLETAQSIWKSRYGRLTSVRVAVKDGMEPAEAAKILEGNIRKQIAPGHLGLAFQPVKANGLAAAVGANDFTQLFLAFSFFLILSAAILIGLLFKLGLERRVSGIGLLSAIGLSPKQIRRVYVGEGLILVLVGGLIGMLAAVGYAALMIHGLKTWWVGAIGTKFLQLHISPVSLFTGFAISVLVMLGVVWWAMRQFKSLSARDMLAGTTAATLTTEQRLKKSGRAKKTAVIAAAIAGILVVATLVGLVPASEAFSGFNWRTVAFFVVGMSFLVASLCAFSAWLSSDQSTAVSGSGLAGIGRLGTRNASRHRSRSVLTVGLIAFATFVIVAVAAGHRNPAVEQPDKNSGNGGFTFVAESSQPILFDLNSAEGRQKLGFEIDEDDEANADDVELLNGTTVVPFHMNPGEDASCLNLYQTKLPTILGVTNEMIERGGFKFADTRVDEPWKLLTQDIDIKDGETSLPVYPVMGDVNTLMYSLKKGIGNRIPVPTEDAPEYYLQVVGMLDASVFQGVLLMSSQNFRRLHPDRAGDQYFLIEPPESKDAAQKVATLLETNLAPYGFDAERVNDRIAGFLAVQNTYLSTFQALGGLGLLLGTLGLATVMLRNVLERRSELALLRGIGFKNGSLSWLVLAENALLLFWGLASGAIAALLAMGPHLLTTGADVPWVAVGLILAGVVVVGTCAAFFAVIEAVRTPIVSTLRGE